MELEALYDEFAYAANDARGISREKFDDFLEMNGPSVESSLVLHTPVVIADRLFAFMDKNSTGYVCFDDYARLVSLGLRGTSEERLRFAFFLCDVSARGYFDVTDLRLIIDGFWARNVSILCDVYASLQTEFLSNFSNNFSPSSTGMTCPLSTDDYAIPPPSDLEISFLKSRNIGELMNKLQANNAQTTSMQVHLLTLRHIANTWFEAADGDGDGRIYYDDFVNAARNDPFVLYCADHISNTL